MHWVMDNGPRNPAECRSRMYSNGGEQVPTRTLAEAALRRRATCHHSTRQCRAEDRRASGTKEKMKRMPED
jgi:hypothetical protein